MIDYWINNKKELIVEGRMYKNERVFSMCCEGHDWIVNLVMPHRNDPNMTAVWGRCNNPDCPEYETEQGISHWFQQDIAYHLLSRSSPN